MQNKKCVNFPMVHHINGASVTECNRPIGMYGEVKRFFSKKHELYYLKVEDSMYPSGEAAQWTKRYPGAASDNLSSVEIYSGTRR